MIDNSKELGRGERGGGGGGEREMDFESKTYENYETYETESGGKQFCVNQRFPHTTEKLEHGATKEPVQFVPVQRPYKSLRTTKK